MKGKEHKVKLYDSRLSGKKKLEVDNEVIVENNNSIAIFNYSFQLDSYYFNLVQLNDSEFDLKINSFFFKDIMECEESGKLKKHPVKKNVENDDEIAKINYGNENNNITYDNNNEDSKNLID